MTTLRRMEYFVAVAESGSFSQAALMLNVTQPGLSQQIQQLEGDLGARLIDRLPRTAVLTEAGRVYLPEARVALQAAARASRAVATLMSGGQGDLEIATVTSVAAGVLPEAMSRWRGQFSNISVRLYEYGHGDNLENDVYGGKADLAIGPIPRDWKGPTVSLGFEEFVVVVSPDDRLTGRGAIDIADLADRPWVLFESSSELSDITTIVCRDAGFAPASTLRTSQVQTGIRLAAAGLGPVLVPDNVIPADLGAAVLRLKQPYRRELAAYARSDFSPTSQAFVELMELTPHLSNPSLPSAHLRSTQWMSSWIGIPPEE
jgi:DNA-binding transcriptional LysR family regulator